SLGEPMAKFSFLGLVALSILACRAEPPKSDARASAQYRVAWEKHVAGDETGYQEMLRQVASSYPDSRQGVRAKQILSENTSGVGATSRIPQFVATIAGLALKSNARSGDAQVSESRVTVSVPDPGKRPVVEVRSQTQVRHHSRAQAPQ